MNFALFVFCASAAQQLSPAFAAAGDTRSASLLKGTHGGSASVLASRALVQEDEESDPPNQPDALVDGSEPPTPPSDTEPELGEGMGPPKMGPAHRDCTPSKFLQPMVSSLLYLLLF
jgi:hypothetical protein